MKNITTRTLTGIIFIVVLVGGIMFHSLAYGIIFLTISTLAIYEFYKLLNIGNTKPNIILGVIANIYIFTSVFLFAKGIFNFTILLPIFALLYLAFIFELYKKSEKPFINIAITLIGIFYISIPFSLLNFIVHLKSADYSYQILIGVLCLIWAFDTGAYVFGVSFGKKRLFERISPKKSWEGTIGGCLISLLTAYIISIFCLELNMAQWIIISLIISITGTYGDLIESLLKRSVNIKDSGNILPGHGGILDRFDSLIFSTPFVFIYLYII